MLLLDAGKTILFSALGLELMVRLGLDLELEQMV